MQIIKTKSFELATIFRGNPDATKFALALPGRLDTKDYVPFPSHLEFLATKGFFAVSFDPPGTWDSPGDLSLFSTTNYIKATNELIEYFGSKPTLLIGHSRGGAVSVLAGCLNPAVVAIAPVMASYGEPTPPDPQSLKEGVKMSYRDLPPGSHKTSEQKAFALSVEYFRDGQKYNATEAIKKCTKPKLMFYGTNDSFTTVDEALKVYESMPGPKMKCELNTEHDYRYHPEIINQVNEELGKFVDKYFK